MKLTAFVCLGVLCSMASASQIPVSGTTAKLLQKRLASAGAKYSEEQATKTAPRKIVYQVDDVECTSIPTTVFSDRCVFRDQNNKGEYHTALPGSARRLFNALKEAKAEDRPFENSLGGGEISVASLRCETPLYWKTVKGTTTCTLVQ